jgi:hypothetical protein
MSKFSGNKHSLKDFLNGNPIKLYIASIVAISACIYGILNFYFQKETENFRNEKEADYSKQLDLIDNERSRINIHIEHERGAFDIRKMIVSPASVPNSYINIKGTPFYIPKLNGMERWSSRQRSLYDILTEMCPGALQESGYIDIYKEEKFICYEKNALYPVTIEDGKQTFYYRPHFKFQFAPWSKYLDADFLQKINQIAYDTHKDILGNDINFKGSLEKLMKDTSISIQVNIADFKRNSLLDQFILEKESRISEDYGSLHTDNYLFDGDYFVISGYYELNPKLSKTVTRLYTIKIAINTEKGGYSISSFLPVTSDYSDVKFMYSLVTSIKIIE